MQHSFDSTKYEVIFDEETGSIKAFRYGEEWQDLTGNNLVYYMLAEVCSLKDALQTLKTPLEAAEKQNQGVGSQEVKDALRKAFIHGKVYAYAVLGDSIQRSNSEFTEFLRFSEEFSSKFN